MVSRRGFIRIGTATVGTLALRPFGMLPAMAQSGPDYRALVCVFLLGGNDSNNTVIPMDDASYSAYQSIRGKSGSHKQRNYARHERFRRALRIPFQTRRSRQPVFE